MNEEISNLTNLLTQLEIQEETLKTIQLLSNTTVPNEEKVAILTAILTSEKARINAENARINAENARINAEKALKFSERIGFLKKNGLPPLPPSNASTSKPSYGHHLTPYMPVNCISNVTFGIPEKCKLVNLVEVPSDIWRRANGDPLVLGNWNDESEIKIFVKDVFRDIIKMLKLEKSILINKLSLTIVKQQIPDILFFEVNGILIGICDVKRPSSSFKKSGTGDIDEQLNEELQNQITNYLLQLKYTYGITFPIGVITTYNEWKICCLDEAYDYFVSIEENFSPPQVSQAPNRQEKKITLFTSEVYKFDNPDLIEVLAGAIYKMHNSVITPLTSILSPSERKFGFINSDTFVWKCLSKPESLTYEMPPKNTRKFYLIQDFHGGRDGRVWLSISESGKLAVCKLTDSISYVNEAKLWNLFWCDGVFTTTLLKANALIMPFVFHGHLDIVTENFTFRPIFGPKWINKVDCTAEDIRLSEISCDFDDSLERHFNDPKTVAKEALEVMAKYSYQHDDLHWRHVGLMPYKKRDTEQWAVKPVLIDLQGVFESTKSFDTIVSEGLTALADSRD
uniref:DUF5898 domain-containing protein n=1 Tax=Chromulina nebulosa TaxID=96789 RepID=A0A7S0SRF7_9STRA|mmetsp:Transcript_1956/g.1753  ORF Transcript_1956/g.1753 Transcript_1956/m.1753 type:complete len:569 (+) Transcript_1956:15-1721(+)|eukprot:CAMPEP_0196762314 /NCGR_PEP_ID=MMETSP1095-20130614/1722_1 /TAXON_ID=96789 ORGANISM="Chromulina nebulosa, Strain UTEXLB2642" /NCGR_SAMPLE_ID=MMETSP1095 /ASSEMBLY_ACC=CAM_ASM_000446 /LENGTH=568 /DNA_ID=CAMNT_0042112939 /DNA_START=15 /DNA_END=1721 /DNA_ORIENTATION=+